MKKKKYPYKKRQSEEPQPQKANETSFKEGNKANEKYDLETAKQVFRQIIDETKEKDWLSIQEAVVYNGVIPFSTFYYLLTKFPELENLKIELQSIIIARINKGAILGNYAPAPAIFRQKMLGEIPIEKHEVKQEISTLKYEDFFE
jgi:hypothetical protein